MTKITPTSMSITNNCYVVQHVLIVYNKFMIFFNLTIIKLNISDIPNFFNSIMNIYILLCCKIQFNLIGVILNDCL